MNKKTQQAAQYAGVFVGAAIVVSMIWSERNKWSWTATWVSGSVTTFLGFLNSNAAALGVLATMVFGLLNWREKRRQTSALKDGIRSGKIQIDEIDQ